MGFLCRDHVRSLNIIPEGQSFPLRPIFYEKDNIKLSCLFNTLQTKINPLTSNSFEKLLGLHLVLPKDVSLIQYNDLVEEQKR
jgi:hypothetical protein